MKECKQGSIQLWDFMSIEGQMKPYEALGLLFISSNPFTMGFILRRSSDIWWLTDKVVIQVWDWSSSTENINLSFNYVCSKSLQKAACLKEDDEKLLYWAGENMIR